MKSVLVAALVLALAGCGGDDGSPSTVGRNGAGAVPLAARCEPGDRVQVTIFVEAPTALAYGVHTTLRYPPGLDIPGHRDDASVVDHVRFVLALPTARLDVPDETFVNGSTAVNDQDTDFDGVDDRIHTLLLSVNTFPVGRFADVTFDCVATIAPPTADLFACEVWDVVDANVVDVGNQSICHVAVAPPRSAEIAGPEGRRDATRG